eukprot:scaffold45_cov368-Prasinococcus_capsulatus_cf.AAC.10
MFEALQVSSSLTDEHQRILSLPTIDEKLVLIARFRYISFLPLRAPEHAAAVRTQPAVATAH